MLVVNSCIIIIVGLICGRFAKVPNENGYYSVVLVRYKDSATLFSDNIGINILVRIGSD